MAIKPTVEAAQDDLLDLAIRHHFHHRRSLDDRPARP